MHIGIGLLFICMSLATASLASAQFPTTLSIKTNASFINDVQPSSDTNTFTVTRLDTSAGSQGSITFQKCTISGSPVTEATNVGNCKWNIFTDGDVILLRFSFNFRIPETDGHWGQFVLVNTNNFGRFSRFWRPPDSDGIGTANGNVAIEIPELVPELVPELEVSPRGANFGLVEVGRSGSARFVIENEGTGILEGEVTTAHPFVIADARGALLSQEFSLEPGGVLVLSIAFFPTSSGTFFGEAIFTSNAGTINALLRGQGCTVSNLPFNTRDDPVCE